MSNNWGLVVERSLAIVLFLLCELLSIAFTIRFASSLAPGFEPVVVGIVLELAKLTYTVMVVSRHYERQFATMTVAAVLMIALSSLSAFASASFFGWTTGSQAKQAIATNDRVAQLDRQVRKLEREHSLLIQAAEADLANNYRSRALDAQDKLVEVRRALDQKGAQLDAAIKAAPVTGISAWDRLLERRRFATVLCLAILLEIIGFAALQLACSCRPVVNESHRSSGLVVRRRSVTDGPVAKPSPADQSHEPSSPGMENPSVVRRRVAKPSPADQSHEPNSPGVRIPSVVNQSGDSVADGLSQNTIVAPRRLHVVRNGDYRIAQLSCDALEQLRSGQVRPAVKDVRDALGVGQAIAQQVMHRLVAEGSLVRSGRRYQLP